MSYPELHAHSSFSFLDGASQPDELAARAAALGYDAFALTDHDGLSGSLAFAHAAREVGVRPITGCEITLEGGAHLTLLCEDRHGYANLCRLITAAHVRDRYDGAQGLNPNHNWRPRVLTPRGLGRALGLSGKVRSVEPREVFEERRRRGSPQETSRRPARREANPRRTATAKPERGRRFRSRLGRSRGRPPGGGGRPPGPFRD